MTMAESDVLGVEHMRARMVGRVFFAHAVGLSVVGIAGTSPEVAFLGLFIGIFMGGILSLPWMIALAILILIRGEWLEQHPVVFAICGPLSVIGSWLVLAGSPWLIPVALSCGISSVLVLTLTLWRHRSPAVESGS
jgi:hypothetical protein